MWLQILRVGIKSLLLHKLRSLLTMVGVLLGVASVIAMLAIGEGSKREALENFRRMGSTNVIIRSVKPGSQGDGDESETGASQQQTSRILEYGLRYKDYDRLVATLPTVEDSLAIALVRKHAQHEHRRIPNARILGTTPNYLTVKNVAVARGRFLSEPDLQTTANVCVLGAGAAQKLFSFQDPIGQPVHLGDSVYTTVGVLERQASGSDTPGAAGQANFNNDIYIPLTAASRRFGELQAIVSAGSRNYERTELSEITLTVKDENLVSQTAAMARKLLEKDHPNGRDYELQVPLEKIKQLKAEQKIWNLVLGSIAGISLLVGGIGIMNIMLATVSERTREIGIRRALGARRIDITIQFFIETIVLSTTGGLLGIALGVAIPFVVGSVSDIEAHVQWWSLPLAFGISVGIGVVFGLYPARKAALMDPIEALRHE